MYYLSKLFLYFKSMRDCFDVSLTPLLFAPCPSSQPSIHLHSGSWSSQAATGGGRRDGAQRSVTQVLLLSCTHVSPVQFLCFFYFTFIKSAHFRHLTEELTLMLQHCLCGYEKLQVVFVILFILSRVCLTLGVFVQVINGAPLVQGIFRDH